MSSAAALYAAALLLLAASFVLYAAILRHLLALVRLEFLWLLPLAGGTLLVLAAAFHWFAAAVLEPVMGNDPQMFRESMFLRTASMACLLACGALAAASGWTCYKRMGD